MKKFVLGILGLGIIFIFCVSQKGKEQKRVIFTDKAPKPIGPYSQAIMAGNTLFLSGQVGIDPLSGKLDSTGIEGETRQAIKNLGAILNAAGMEYKHIVKTSVFLRHMHDFEKMNKVYAQFFSEASPARETTGSAELPKGVHIEISAIAVK